MKIFVLLCFDNLFRIFIFNFRALNMDENINICTNFKTKLPMNIFYPN